MSLFRFCPFDGRQFQQQEVVCPLCREPRFPLSCTWRFQKAATQDLLAWPERPPWRKILFEQQPYEDTFVDLSFLDSLLTNSNVQEHYYLDLCRKSVHISQPFCCVAIFIGCYALLRLDTINVKSLIVTDFVLLFGGFALIWRLNSSLSSLDICRGAMSALNTVTLTWIMAPVIQTLTQSYSNDTLYTLTALILIVHLICNDFQFVLRHPPEPPQPLPTLEKSPPAKGGYPYHIPAQSPCPSPLSSSIPPPPPIGSSPVSYKGKTAHTPFRHAWNAPQPIGVNAAMLAAALLASRLRTPIEVFAITVFAIEVLVLSLVLRREIWRASVGGYTLALSGILFISGYFLLFHCNKLAARLFVLCIGFINFVGPLWFKRSQRYKSEIRGPWDVAEVPSYG